MFQLTFGRSHLRFANKSHNLAVKVYKISTIQVYPDESLVTAVITAHQSLELALKALVLMSNQSIYDRKGRMMGLWKVVNAIYNPKTKMHNLKRNLRRLGIRKGDLLRINDVRNKLQHDNCNLNRYHTISLRDFMRDALRILHTLLDLYGLDTSEITIVRSLF